MVNGIVWTWLANWTFGQQLILAIDEAVSSSSKISFGAQQCFDLHVACTYIGIYMVGRLPKTQRWDVEWGTIHYAPPVQKSKFKVQGTGWIDRGSRLDFRTR